MPKAVIDISATKRIDLKSCPGGFIELRRMSYGQKLQRQSMAMDMAARGEGKNAEMTMKMAQRRVVAFEFGACIVDHNLENEREQKLSFGQEGVLDILDPRVGDEISLHIERMNNFDDEDDPINAETVKNRSSGSEHRSY